MTETPIRDCELEFVDDIVRHLILCGDDVVANCSLSGAWSPDVDKKNAERLAACWNALRGIPSDILPTLWGDIETACDADIPKDARLASMKRLLRLCELRKTAGENKQ